MDTGFRVHGLPLSHFTPMFGLDDQELRRLGARRLIADEKPGYPCRVSLADADIDEPIIALPFRHHDVTSPYRASGPIFVRESATEANLPTGQIPGMLRGRLLSVRAYDEDAIMIGAEVVNGNQIEAQIQTYFQNPQVAYLQIHNARPGCFNCTITRA